MKNIPTLAGSAIRQVSRVIGSEVSESGRLIQGTLVDVLEKPFKNGLNLFPVDAQMELLQQMPALCVSVRTESSPKGRALDLALKRTFISPSPSYNFHPTHPIYDTTGGIPRLHIRVYASLKIVRRGSGAYLDASELLTKLIVGFTTRYMVDPRTRKQIALVGGFQKDLGAGRIAVFENDLRDPVAISLNLLLPMFEKDRDFQITEHGEKECFHLGRALYLLFEEVQENQIQEALELPRTDAHPEGESETRSV